MAENFDPVPELAALVLEALRNGTGASAEYAGRIAEQLGLGEDDSPETAAGVFREALDLGGVRDDLGEIGHAIRNRSNG